MPARILLVEGSDDQHVIWALLGSRKVSQVFDVQPVGGIDKLLESLPVRLKASGLERLAVVLDADTNLDSRWQSISDILRNSGNGQLPKAPEKNGTLLTLATGIQFGIWLMPDNELPGMLENFVARLVPKSDTMMAHVDRFLSGIPEDARKFPAVQLPKASIHAWLAVQEAPGKPMGQAITATYLTADHDSVDLFIQWIDRALVK